MNAEQNCTKPADFPEQDEATPLTAPVTVRVGCKINLYLRITGVRQGGEYYGWHELDTVFLPLSEPHDTLVITPTPRTGHASGSGLTVQCQTPGIDLANNTLTKAYQRYATRTGFAPQMTVELHKGIPHGAGLGGGSADAAGLLLWMNAHAPHPLSHEALIPLATAVGADVPFFLARVPCRARGLGDELTQVRLPMLQGLHLVLVCPEEKVATPWAFKAYDDDIHACADAVNAKKKQIFFAENLTGISQRAIDTLSRLWCEPLWLENSFEKIVFKTHSGLAKHKVFLLQSGATSAVMSGSGSSIFGLFRCSQQAQMVMTMLRERGVMCFHHPL